MKMTKLLSLLMALMLMALVLTACGPKQDPTTAPNNTTTKPTELDPTQPSHAHSYTETVTAPTCTQKGYTTYTCACGVSYTGAATAELGHSWSQWITILEPTEEAEGDSERSCSACGEKENKKLPPLSHTHSYTETVKAPTCTEKGYTTHTCACGDSYITDETVPFGHGWGEWITVQEPALGVEGKSERTCGTCGETESQSIPALTVEYEEVVTGADFITALQLAGGEGVKPTTDITVGKITFGAGCYFESSKGDYFTELAGNVNTQKKRITIVLSGMTNSIRFDARGATGSGAVLTLSKADGTVVYTSDNIPNSTLVENIKIDDLQAGTYYLDSSGSCRIGDLFITERLEKAEAVSIELNPGNTAFLSGRGVSADGLTVQLVYANGRKDTLQNDSYTVDLAAVDANAPGKYTVTVTHTETGFSASYDVVVYRVESIRVSDHILDDRRVTQLVQKLYLEGSSYDNYANAAVIATCSAPGVEGKMDFLLREGEYSFAPATKENPRIVVTANSDICHQKGVTAGYDITILAVSANVNKTHIIVDANGNVGEGADHVVTVKTVNDALRLFTLLEADDAARKTITLCAGTYYEKVEVSIPNLSIVAKEGSSPEDVVIIYDALNGLSAPNGPSYSTDGSATFSLRATATGFYGKGFTLMNYYNNHERYEASKKIAGSGTQAVACLVRADQVIFEDMRLSSYQDTLYADNGRHIYRNCYIEGRTDYIFGDNATAYFEGCTIRSIYGNSSENGGYVIATKGGSASAKVEYGYIFNNCIFEGEEAVTAGSVSIARGWDKYMTIMIMNSQISDKFSLEVYGDTSSNKNDRYTKMNADPVAGQLFEFGNTGAGALTQELLEGAVDGLIEKLCTVPTAERAADFADFAKIFAATNGTVKYADDWDGKHGGEVSKNKMILLTDFTGHIEGGTGEYKDIYIDATEGKFKAHNDDWVQINAGTVLTFSVEEGAQVTAKFYNDASYYEIKVENGIATITVLANTYIQSITVTY